MALSVNNVVKIIKSVLGDKYKLEIVGSYDDMIYITNTITGKNNFLFLYKDSVDYNVFPFRSCKTLEFREHIGINATSERYCQQFNPKSEEIQDFVKVCFQLN